VSFADNQVARDWAFGERGLASVVRDELAATAPDVTLAAIAHDAQAGMVRVVLAPKGSETFARTVGAPPAAPRDEFARDATRRAVERLRGGAR
jgi:hypothetical protein